jgi:hypothetical protein
MSDRRQVARQRAAMNSAAVPVSSLEAGKLAWPAWQMDEAPALRARSGPFGR